MRFALVKEKGINTPGQALDPLGSRGWPRGIKPFDIVAHSEMLVY
jgi:hypothetical protein